MCGKWDVAGWLKMNTAKELGHSNILSCPIMYLVMVLVMVKVRIILVKVISWVVLLCILVMVKVRIISPCAYCPIFFGCDTASFTVTIRKIYPMLWKGNNSRITEHSSGVGHEQQEDDRVEENDVEASPEGCWHSLKDDPPDDHIVGVQYCSIGHKNAEKSARVFLKNRHYVRKI